MDRIELPLSSIEEYFLERLAEEQRLAANSANSRDRDAHLRACRLLRQLLQLDADPDGHLLQR